MLEKAYGDKVVRQAVEVCRTWNAFGYEVKSLSLPGLIVMVVGVRSGVGESENTTHA